MYSIGKVTPASYPSSTSTFLSNYGFLGLQKLKTATSWKPNSWLHKHPFTNVWHWRGLLKWSALSTYTKINYLCIYLLWIQVLVLWGPPCSCAPQGRHNSFCVPLLCHAPSHWLFHYLHSFKSVPSTSITRRTSWRQPQSVGAAKAANNGWRWNWSQSLCRLPVYFNGFVCFFGNCNSIYRAADS